MKREEINGYPCTEKGRHHQARQEQGKISLLEERVRFLSGQSGH